LGRCGSTPRRVLVCVPVSHPSRPWTGRTTAGQPTLRIIVISLRVAWSTITTTQAVRAGNSEGGLGGALAKGTAVPPSGVRRCSGAHSVRSPACVGRLQVVAIGARARRCATQLRLRRVWCIARCRVPVVVFACGPDRSRPPITASGFRRFDDVAVRRGNGASVLLMPGI
jgi:hypothetical protein